jgi:hypothetical protein
VFFKDVFTDAWLDIYQQVCFHGCLGVRMCFSWMFSQMRGLTSINRCVSMDVWMLGCVFHGCFHRCVA